MIRRYFRFLARRAPVVVALLTLFSFLSISIVPAWAMNSTRGGVLPQPLPLFSADNWWNLDISSWPVDGNSSSYIAFINNGGTRRLHPDFGGNAGSGFSIYGMPYAVVTGVTNADLKAVQFQYSSESDGVDHRPIRVFHFIPSRRKRLPSPIGWKVAIQATSICVLAKTVIS